MLQLYSNWNFNALFVRNLIFTTNMVIRFNEIAIIRNYDLCYVCIIRFVCCIFPFEIRKVKTSSIWLDILIASCFVIRYSKHRFVPSVLMKSNSGLPSKHTPCELNNIKDDNFFLPQLIFHLNIRNIQNNDLKTSQKLLSNLYMQKSYYIYW